MTSVLDFYTTPTLFAWLSQYITNKVHYLKLVLTTGQVCLFKTAFVRWVKQQRYCFLRTDFYSNKIWATLDEPKLFINLVRFERRYRMKIDLTKFSPEDLKLR